ncbi:MAG: tRNA threonylcarbamoyladenosine dehydratase [Clostridia bacterium]|nr:tRNA threonylcarbamoyladenosine dehydratase [Clostridia bacterium]
MTQDWLHRERMLLGDEAVSRLENKTVLLFGVGGVGSYALEAIVRAGIGGVALVDNDTVSMTNINRQLIADTTTVGRLKTEVAAERVRAINPGISVTRYDVFADGDNIPSIIDEVSPDYIIDAIDTVSSKLAIISAAKERGIPVISSMGTGSKLDPTRFRIVDITKTHTCPLAKVMRLKLREMGIAHCEVLFSDELPIKASCASELEGQTTRHIPGSISFVPSAAGLIIGGHVVKKLAGIE